MRHPQYMFFYKASGKAAEAGAFPPFFWRRPKHCATSFHQRSTSSEKDFSSSESHGRFYFRGNG